MLRSEWNAIDILLVIISFLPSAKQEICGISEYSLKFFFQSNYFLYFSFLSKDHKALEVIAMLAMNQYAQKC
jgi:hypothetical protein